MGRIGNDFHRLQYSKILKLPDTYKLAVHGTIIVVGFISNDGYTLIIPI